MSQPASRSDPSRSLALLWGPRPQSGRGPQSGLNSSQIVAAAIQIADTGGIGAVTMRGIADTLGVGAMSLYRHVPGKDELIDLMMDTVMGEQYLDYTAETGWRRQLAAYARNALERRLRHPWILDVSHNRTVQGPNWVAVLDAVATIVDGIGLSDWEMAATVELVTGYVDHAARNEFELTQADVADASAVQLAWWEGSAPAAATWMPRGQFPVHERMTRIWYNQDEQQDMFTFGLERVLDGIDMLVTARATTHDE